MKIQIIPEAVMWLEDTPVGSLYIGASGKGLVFIRFADPKRTREQPTINHFHPNQSVISILKETEEQLRAYFAGIRRIFKIPMDLGELPEFTHKVLSLTAQIPFGRVVTYGGLAARAGSPKGARAVGGAMRSNPIPIVIPCHRVLSSDYKLHGYSAWGGLKAKAALLELEGLRLEGDRVLGITGKPDSKI